MTSSHLPRTADAVVIGGGALGTSICYRLAASGLRTVLVERKGLASGCTGTTVALVNASSKGPPAHYTELNLRSAQLYRSLSEELGADIGFEGRGNMGIVAETQEELEEVRRVAMAQSEVPGLRVEALDSGQAREMLPALSPHVVGATFCAADGCVNSFRLTLAHAAAAQRHGAQIVTGATVTDIPVRASRVTGVVTDLGPISAPVVAMAAGIHTPALAEKAGLRIPAMAKRGQIVTTEPLPPLLPIPVGQLRQVAWGSVIIGSIYENAGYTRDTEVPTLASLASRALRIFPALAGVRAIRFWSGLRPWPADGLSIIGRAPGVEGLYVAVTHSGITLAPVIGIALSELVVDGSARIVDISHYSLDRFDSSDPPGEDFDAFWKANRERLSRV